MRKKTTDVAPAGVNVVIPHQISYTPKISVIVPVYNVENYLAECLDSVINQSLREIEIICVNDGSTDGSLKILEEYAEKDKRIAVISQENQMLGAARNNALKIASGDYIQFLDSDDYLDLNTCENLYRKCKSLNLDMLSFRGTNFNNDTREILGNPYYEFRYLPKDWGKNVFNYRDCTEFLTKMAVSSCLTLVKRSFLKKHKINFPEKLCYEDNVFFVKCITKARRVSIDKNLYYYRRIHPESITQNNHKHFKDKLKIYELMLQYLRDANVDYCIYRSYKETIIKGALYLYSKFSSLDPVNYRKALHHLIELIKNDRGPTLRMRWGLLKVYFFLPYYLFNVLSMKKEYVKLINKNLSPMRIDIKNTGGTKHSVSITANGATISSPSWFANAQGIGKIVESCEHRLIMNVQVRMDGKLTCHFRASDKRYIGEKFPLWVDYVSIYIDGQEILPQPVATWHDEPFCYEMPVKDGQKLTFEIETRQHGYSIEELEDILSKIYLQSDYIHCHWEKIVQGVQVTAG